MRIRSWLEHARAARQRAGRIAVVRETNGVAAYHAGEWAEALSELRTARRMSGGAGLLAVMADCERGLGRPERAIELGRSDEARLLKGDEATELRIVVAGARMDLGQYDQAVVSLQTTELDPSKTGSASARLFYAYAEALLAAGRAEESLTWFMNAASADTEGETDAEDRAADLAEGGSGHSEWTTAVADGAESGEDDESDWTAAVNDGTEDDEDADAEDDEDDFAEADDFDDEDDDDSDVVPAAAASTEKSDSADKSDGADKSDSVDETDRADNSDSADEAEKPSGTEPVAESATATPVDTEAADKAEDVDSKK